MWMISANTDNRQVLIRDNFHGEWRVRCNLRPGFTQKTLETVMTGQILSVCINYLETDGRMKLCISCQCKYYCDDRVSAGTKENQRDGVTITRARQHTNSPHSGSSSWWRRTKLVQHIHSPVHSTLLCVVFLWLHVLWIRLVYSQPVICSYKC